MSHFRKYGISIKIEKMNFSAFMHLVIERK